MIERLDQAGRDWLDDFPCGIIAVSPDDIILHANTTIINWLGTSRKDLQGKRFSELLNFGGRIAFETHVRPMLRMEGRVQELALDLMDAHGDRVPFMANAKERRDADGTHTSTEIALFKAVDRRTYERTLLDARIMAQSVAAREQEIATFRDRFIALLGHDLRNPLSAINSGVNLLDRIRARAEQDDQADPEIKKRAFLFESIRSSVKRAIGLVDDMLDLAKGHVGTDMTIARTEVPNLGTELEKVVDEIRLVSTSRDFVSDWMITDPVEIDLPRISQMLANLLSNADRHGDAHGPIRIIGRTEAEFFELSVENEGAEIPQSVRDQLFKPFVQGPDNKNSDGLGLGLFIVSEVAEAHAGKMDIECAENRIRFIFKMPRLVDLIA